MRFNLPAGLALLLTSATSQAAILSFDIPGGEPFLTTADVDGFRFTSEHFHIFSDGLGYASNGTTYLVYEGVRGFPITMSLISGGEFSLRGFDVAEAESGSVLRPAAEAIGVTGYRADGSTVNVVLWLDGIHDGVAPGSANDFQPLTLPPAFVNLTSVLFYGVRLDGQDGGVALDNLDYETGVVVGDTTPPTVSLTSPAPGGVSGSVLVAAVANDSVGVAGVQFKLDGANLGALDTQSPYSLAWDTTSALEGTHTISAEARDAAGNVGTASVIVSVSNGSAGAFFMSLDGVNDYLEALDAANLSFSNGTTDTPFTFETWFMPASMSVKQNLLGKWGNNASQEYKVHIASGLIRIDLRDSARSAIASAYTNGNLTALAGVWHHLAVTYDGRGGATAANGLSIYIDGVPASITRQNNAAYVAMQPSTATLKIGHESNGWRQYAGGLDEIRMWNIVRSQAQIQAQMSTELAGTESGLVAYWKLNEGGGTALADSSTGGNMAIAYNGTTWTAGGSMQPPVLDTTPPVISGVLISAVTDTSATITFSTSENATGWVSYTSGSACPCVDVNSQGPGTAHTVHLTGLSPDDTYVYQAKATDTAGNLGLGPTLGFTTLPPAPDQTLPIISLTSPTATTVSGTIAVAASATDNVGVIGVQFKLDGTNLEAEDTTVPYSISWNTTGVGDGPHTITAEARDAAGNVGTSLLALTVANQVPPSTPYFLSFDGVNDYAQVAGPLNLSFSNGTADTPFTIETWIRPTNMGLKQSLIGRWGVSAANQEYKLAILGAAIRIDLRDSNTSATAFAFVNADLTALNGAWHHVAVTYDGRGGATAANGITIYLDGVPASLGRGNNAAYVAMRPSTAPLEIGRESNGWRQYLGGLDEIRMWNLVRTQAQIQTQMSAAIPPSEPGLVAYWRFNEGTGVTATDSSVQGSNVATLFNGPVWNAGGL